MSDKKINLEEIILEAYGCKDVYDFNKSYDVSIQMTKEICIEACRQALELAAENVQIIDKKVEYTGVRAGGYYTVPVVDKQSILDVIKLIE